MPRWRRLASDDLDLDGAASTKEKLLRAGERLFAQHGIHRVALREINALAGQRNPSALHYHFGSRDGLVAAILAAHQGAMDDAISRRLDQLEARDEPATVREVVEATVRPLADQLLTPSGRDFLRILPQVLHLVSEHLRGGAPLAGSVQPLRTLELLDGLLRDLPPAARKERLISYAVVLTTLFAERAQALESGTELELDHEQFTCHALDVITGALVAPSSVPVRRGRARSPRASSRR